MTPSEQAKRDADQSGNIEETADLSNDSASGEGEDSPVSRLEAEVAKYKDQWIRAVADAENLRKRSQKDVEETSRYAVSGFARDLVSVLENLQRALDSIPSDMAKENAVLNNLREGVTMTLNELVGVFERNGIKRISPLGEKFDHNYHQAVAQVEAPDAEPGTIVQVLQAGYIIHDRLLRPAMVAVSKKGDVAKKVDTTA